ncbi:hypothetical protein ES705_06397 [subsurface metagenome]
MKNNLTIYAISKQKIVSFLDTLFTHGNCLTYY